MTAELQNDMQVYFDNMISRVYQQMFTSIKYQVNVGSFSVDSHCGVRVTPVLLPVPIVGLHGNTG